MNRRELLRAISSIALISLVPEQLFARHRRSRCCCSCSPCKCRKGRSIKLRAKEEGNRWYFVIDQDFLVGDCTLMAGAYLSLTPDGIAVSDHLVSYSSDSNDEFYLSWTVYSSDPKKNFYWGFMGPHMDDAHKQYPWPRHQTKFDPSWYPLFTGKCDASGRC
jgi:hypothetical protein